MRKGIDFRYWCLMAGVVAFTSGSAQDQPEGFFVSPAGLSSNDGTFDSPWDLLSAVDGTHSIPAGETLYLLDGDYPKNSSNPANVYDVVLDGVTITPLNSTYQNPYPAKIAAGIHLGDDADGNTLRNLFCYNPTPKPFSEPTEGGSPWPGFPDPAPTGWEFWQGGGTISSGKNSGNVILNCVATGGAGGFSSFKSRRIRYEGCIAFLVGWRAVDRRHGHPYYLQNPSNAAADRNRFRASIGSVTEYRVPSKTGRIAFNFFSTTAHQQNWEISESYAKGSGIFQSQNLFARNAVYRDIVFEAAAVGLAPGAQGGDNITFGRPTSADEGISITNLLALNGRKVADNANLKGLTQTNIRQVRTRREWYVKEMDGPPAFEGLESGTFIDAMANPIPDEAFVWRMPSDSKVCHAYIVDFSGDGKVSVDLSAVAAAGDAYCAYHYRSADIASSTGSLPEGVKITLSVVDFNVQLGSLDTSDAYVIRFQ
jgi:hypothetical protein